MDRPNSAGLWKREGKFCLISNCQFVSIDDDGDFIYGCLADLPAGDWQNLDAESNRFSCPQCTGLHSGTQDATLPKEQWVRECHDQLHTGCKWRGSDAECMVSAALALERFSRAVDERLATKSAAKADKQFREWISNSKHCPCGWHRQMDIADKAAEIFAGVREGETTTLKATIARLEGEIAGLKRDKANFENAADHLADDARKMGREVDAAAKHHSACRDRIDKALGEPRYDDCDIWTAFERRIAELRQHLATAQDAALAVRFPLAPPPEVIEGRGQRVEEPGFFWCERPDGAINGPTMKRDTFADGYRYLRLPDPTFPPRKPAFVAPPKPELVLLRHKSSGLIAWAAKEEDGHGYRTVDGRWWEQVELLDETTGEVLPAEKVS